MTEVALLGRALDGDQNAILACDTYSQPIKARKTATHVNKPQVQARLNSITASLAERSAPYAERAAYQAEVLGLPLLPTTTIGSFLKRVKSVFSAVLIVLVSYLSPTISKHLKDTLRMP